MRIAAHSNPYSSCSALCGRSNNKATLSAFTSPGPNYLDNRLLRNAQLTLDSDGHVHGVIQETMTGVLALAWRQAALRGDEAETIHDFEKALQRSMPSGVQVSVKQFTWLADFTHPLMVVASVSGQMGTQTGKHMFLPGVFFESANPPLFAAEQRDATVDMHYPFMVDDQFRLSLPPNITIDSLPQSSEIPFAQGADYITKFAAQPHLFAYGRLLTAARFLYKAADYPALRGFYQKVSTSDQQQLALKIQK